MSAIPFQTPLGKATQEHTISRCVAEDKARIVGLRKLLARTRLRLRGSSWDLDLWQEGPGGPPCVTNHYKRMRVARSSTLESQLQGGPQRSHDSFVLGSSRRIDQLQNLCMEGHLERALHVLSNMEMQGAIPSDNMYGCVLKACVKRKALVQARRVHALLAKNGLQTSIFLGEYIVFALVECGGLEDALQVFHQLPHRTVFSWTSVISGYCLSGQGQQGLKMYHRMQDEGVQPNTYTFVSLLKSCGSMANLEGGRHIHAEALKYNCERDVFVQTSLLDMYVKCGSVGDAQIVFDGLPARNVVSWTVMLAAYNHHGQAERTLQLYEGMLEEGISPDDRSFVIMLQAYGMLAEQNKATADGSGPILRCLEKGKVLHADAWRKGYEPDAFVGNTLVSMYCRCGSLLDAQSVFGKLPQRDVVSWSAMLGAYAQQSEAEKALELYEVMLEEGVSSNVRTFVSVLQACSALLEHEEHAVLGGKFAHKNFLQKGKVIHADAWRKGYTLDVFLGNTLVSLYGKCGSIVDAQNVFDGLPNPDLVSWTVLISGYVQQGNGEKALQLYKTMRGEGWSPDDRTFVTALQACSMLAEAADAGQLIKPKPLEMGKALQADAWTMGHESDVFIASSLIVVYGKCGSIVDAQSVFDALSHQTLVAWNAILSVHVEHGKGVEALELYRVMQENCIAPNKITFLCILQACSHTGSLAVCRQIHQTLVAVDHRLTLLLGNALIHAYGSCASIVDAEAVFDALPQPDVVSWTALLAAYARQGQYIASLQCYRGMQRAGVQPNKVTFLLILSACNHSGWVEQGVEFFESMTKGHGICPDIDHYACLVGMLGRAGYFASAKHLMLTMPMKPNVMMWLCLMDACRMHGKVAMGKEAFDYAVRLQPQHGAAYILMSNIYADAGLWNFAADMQERRQNAGAWKKPGESWIEYEQELYTFVAGDHKHSRQKELCILLVTISLELKS